MPCGLAERFETYLVEDRQCLVHDLLVHEEDPDGRSDRRRALLVARVILVLVLVLVEGEWAIEAQHFLVDQETDLGRNLVQERAGSAFVGHDVVELLLVVSRRWSEEMKLMSVGSNLNK